MTLVLTVKNQTGPTAILKRMTKTAPPATGPHQEEALGELAPGAESQVSIWAGAYLVIEEKGAEPALPPPPSS